MLAKSPLSLKQRVLQSGSWTLIGYGANQTLRLGGNLVLTRLLFPEAFGIMAIIQAAIFGITMLTDMGLSQAIIQNRNGNHPEFINTAWTIQVIRGFLGWLILCALAYPLAYIYREPLLASILPVIGLTAIIAGFNSTKLYTAQRNMELSRATLIEVGSYSLGLISTIYLAWLQQSVWALVWGQIFTVSLKVIASHLLLSGIRNRFTWNRNALASLLGFGRWILLSSSLTFLSVEGARLLIGAMLDMRQLALYTLASTLSMMLWQAMQQLAGKVFFPAYAEVYRSNPDRLFSVLLKARLILILPSWLLAVVFVFFGPHIMGTLYDTRYAESGHMLELLAAGLLIRCLWGAYSGLLMAMGKVAAETTLTAIQIVFQIGAIYAGYHMLGEKGIVMGVAAANWITYPVYAFMMHRNKLWQPKLDLVLLVASMMVVALAWPNLA